MLSSGIGGWVHGYNTTNDERLKYNSTNLMNEEGVKDDDTNLVSRRECGNRGENSLYVRRCDICRKVIVLSVSRAVPLQKPFMSASFYTF